jgi:hypothetical protein
MTYEEAAAVLQRHYTPYRPSANDGHIQALSYWTDREGTAGETWEDVPMTSAGLGAWLGY